jgi:uncharacterized protein YdhG (YjbR/CyaY superfamily)
MKPEEFLTKLTPERKSLLSAIHEIILNKDKNAKAEVEKMMGKEMIIYKTSGVFKYGLSDAKNYISLHLMPIYGSAKLHSKYEKLLDKAKFQKGCINFKNEKEMPLDILKNLISDCARVDLIALIEKYRKEKSLAKKM